MKHLAIIDNAYYRRLLDDNAYPESSNIADRAWKYLLELRPLDRRSGKEGGDSGF